MDTGSALIGLIIVLLCALPFILLGNSQKRKEKQLVRSLSQLAEKKNGHIDQYETGRDFAIGLDRVGGAVFFYKNLAGQESSQYIRLAEIEQCDVKSVSRNQSPEKGSRRHIDEVQLIFIPIHKDEAVIKLELYNSEENLQLDRELQLAEKWKKLLRELLVIKV
jgi:hypothetical protein